METACAEVNQHDLCRGCSYRFRDLCACEHGWHYSVVTDRTLLADLACQASVIM